MDAPSSQYRIDYDDIDVVDIVRQIRERAHGGRALPEHPAADEERFRSRLRAWLDAADARAFSVQRELGLEGAWNVSPEDLVTSRPGGLGRLIAAVRRLLRPLLKVAVNADLPLFKQFKVNIGVAGALHDLMRENEELRRTVGELREGLDALRDDDEH